MHRVFQADPKVPRRVKDPRTDHRLPPMGSLSWPTVMSDTALSGTTGVDCMLVTGNRWQEMKGSLTENYTHDKKIDVRGKHQETIKGDRSITVTSGNIERTVLAGKLTDKVAQSHEEMVGANYELQSATQKFIATRSTEMNAGTLVDIKAAMVKINS
jgi:hypothetical protein